jgi:hypothetical protein
MQDKSSENYSVTGSVADQRDAPLPNITVKAFDRDLRREQVLGEARTDRVGAYRIAYSASQFRQAEKANADLIVRAFAVDGSLLAESPILFNAPAKAEVNLIAVDDTPLFEKIARELRPLLENLRVEELEEDDKHRDLTFLAGETGIEKRDLARFVLAHRLARRAIQPEFWFAVLGGSFYAYSESQPLAAQFNDILERLPALQAEVIGKALKSSFNRNHISRSLEDKADRWVSAFLKFAAALTVSESGAPTFAKSALDDAGIKDPKQREKFARLYNQHRSMTAAMLKSLERDKSFKPKEIADLRTSFELQELTQTDFSVVKAIKDEFGIRRPEQIRTLAKKSEKEWIRMVTSKRVRTPFSENKLSKGKAKVPEAEIFGKTLERQFREAYPTTAFAGGLERALKNGGSRGLRHAETLGKFLERHETFELLNTPVDDFLKNRVQPAFRKLASDESFKLEVKAVQRVFKLAPRFEATDALLADDLHSAQQIYRMGESEFVRRYEKRPGFTTESAHSAWSRAANTHAAVLTVVGDLKALEADTLPQALGFDPQALAGFPNWNNLFQTGDMCDCGHCNSVLSPAAYYADVLMFLKDRPAKNPPGKVKDILFDRRPDLGFLELNCENALTTLPYVDVVCEVLEDAVDTGGANDLVLAGLTAIPANAVAAKTAVANAFANALLPTANVGKQKIALGADFSLSQVYPPPGPPPPNPNLWVVHGDDATYLLKKKAGPNFHAKILRNTKTTADELRAFPQYVNPKAYETLRSARYPIALPFDLFAEEVRASFQKTNLQRWDLMRTLRGSASPSEGEIAAEYFGISAGLERDIILQANASVGNQKILWGEPSANWLNRISNVKTFLLKTGLEYNDLLAMLDLEFINPAGDIAVQHLDDSCDTDQKVIQVLTAAKLDRIHRFIRLWRKLPAWKIWELDLVIRHPAIGAGTLDETFLINLFYFVRLQKRLGKKATIEQTCALLGDLNVKTRFTKLHEKRENALYHGLFLNKRFINPLDPAFEIDETTGDLPAGQTITAHHPTILAALRIREADLVLLQTLTRASDGTPYITDVLGLANLSFLWRHAWLSKTLKIKAEDWKIVLKLLQQDVAVFSDPKAALEFVEEIDQLKNTGFAFDELNWLITADRTAKSAVKESDAARFLTSLRKELQLIQAEHDPAQYEFLAPVPPTDTDSLAGLLTSLLQKLNRPEPQVTSFLKTLSGEILLEAPVVGLPSGFVFPATVTGAPGNIPVQYNEDTGTLHFVGLMSDAQRLTLLGVNGAAGYQTAVEALFEQSQNSRLAVKFFESIFTSALAVLPSAIDFKAQLDAELAAKISYDAEQHLLRFAGVMTQADQDLLNALVPSVLPEEIAYHNAVNDLAAQPQAIPAADERVWISDDDLDSTLPGNGTYAERLANAIREALAYLSRTLSKDVIVQQSSSQLGLTEALTRRLLTDYAILPDNLLSHLTNVFATTTGVVDYATLKPTFDGWFWANRVAAIWNKWKVNFSELDRIISTTPGSQIVDLSALPLDDTQPIVPTEVFARTHGLIRLRDSLPETSITFFEVLEKLNAGAYATEADFAADVELLNEAWPAADSAALINALDLNYPNDYLLAENWERLRRAFYFLDSLNAGADTAISFASAAMSESHRQTIRELLLSKFGDETWAVLSTEIQDVLRERKRDSLVAYLLSGPKPLDAPSGKWENANDLYAYYLLDVEMSSCQLTSRLVQGSGSLQLFVQRCFMGLEPEVVVASDGADGESAWRWWEWMRKYRVWEANRKVFLWPENWIEPELKVDRSSFFRDLENELLQNEVNQYTVEAAFQSYLEKLDGVAQLEIAGFYQEDDGDLAIVHVFGRTKGAEPHLYYYRTYDYRQWSPWEKVDLDIQGNYLIPAVINKRLFLFWPVFTEIPDEASNNEAVEMPGGSMTPDGENGQKIEMDDAPVRKPKKRLRLQMAVSDYRNGLWSPQKVSTDFKESGPYEGEIIRKHYKFYPIDRSEIDGTFGIKFEGTSMTGNTPTAGLLGSFEIANCKGVPARTDEITGSFVHIVRPEEAATGERTVFHKWSELGLPESGRADYPENDFTLENRSTNQLTRILTWTMLWRFKMSPPWHLSYLDKLFYDGLALLPELAERSVPLGSWLPFFYNDRKRTFFVLPVIKAYQRDPRPSLVGSPGDGSGSIAYYYPDLKKFVRALENAISGHYQTWLDSVDFSNWSPSARQALEQLLYQVVPGEFPPPYADEQLKQLLKRYLMRFIHFYLGSMALQFLQNSRYHFKNFYHPFVCDFAKLLYNPLKGIPALMSRETQLKDSGFSFRQNYVPTTAVIEPSTEEYYPRENVDFTPDGAYSPYNWELFFHAPLLIANSLSKNQRFEEAREWYHFIFNPLGVESQVPGGSIMSRYWITKPFFENTDPQYVQQRIENIMRMLAGDTSIPGYSPQAKKDLEDQVFDWRTNPFEPHRIANYRTVAYQKNVVMKYLDNLISWGDYLFRQDSMESINEATQLYWRPRYSASVPEKFRLGPNRASRVSMSWSMSSTSFPTHWSKLRISCRRFRATERAEVRLRCRCSISVFRETTRCWDIGTPSPTGFTRSVTA